MRRFISGLSVALLLILATVVAVYVLRDNAAPAPNPPIEQPAPRDSTRARAAATGIQQPLAPVPRIESAASTSHSLARRLRNSENLRDFLRSIHADAKAGDAGAQYHMYLALVDCEVTAGLFVDSNGHRRTLDEVLSMAVGYSLDSEEVRRAHDRCRTLMEAGTAEFGPSNDWLRYAATSGLPQAQAMWAMYTLSFQEVDIDDRVLEAQKWLGTALRSRDPEVIWSAGELHMLSESPRSSIDEQLAWFLAACARGLDCGAGTDRARAMCAQDRGCQPFESVPDLIQRNAAGRFAAIDERSREIVAHLEAGEWEDLGFGLTIAGP